MNAAASSLAALMAAAGLAAPAGAEATVTAFAIDHRKVAPGTVFGAFPGARVNGEDFIDAAIAAGAIAVVARTRFPLPALLRQCVHWTKESAGALTACRKPWR